MGWRRRDLVVERAVEGALIGLVALPVAALVGYLGTAPFPLGILEIVRTRSRGCASTSSCSASACRSWWRSWPRPVPSPAGGAGAPAPTRPPLLLRRLRALRRRDAARRRAPFRHVERRRPPPVASDRDRRAGHRRARGRSLGRLRTHHRRRHPGTLGGQLRLDVRQPLRPGAGDLVTPLIDVDDVSAATGATSGRSPSTAPIRRRWRSPRAKGDLVPTVLEGRVPRTDDEIGIGAEVARRVGVDVGDHVEVAGVTGDPDRMLVVGIVVLPGTAGNGATMTFDSYRADEPGRHAERGAGALPARHARLRRRRGGGRHLQPARLAAHACEHPGARAGDRRAVPPLRHDRVHAAGERRLPARGVGASPVDTISPPFGRWARGPPAAVGRPLAGDAHHRRDGHGRRAARHRRQSARGPLDHVDLGHRADHRPAGLARCRRRRRCRSWSPASSRSFRPGVPPGPASPSCRRTAEVATGQVCGPLSCRPGDRSRRHAGRGRPDDAPARHSRSRRFAAGPTAEHRPRRRADATGLPTRIPARSSSSPASTAASVSA